MPATAVAVRRGEVNSGHVDVISDCLDRLPADVDASAVETVESTLVRAARQEHPGALRRTAALLLARIDPDGLEPREQEQERRRELTLSRNRDGSGRLVGRLTVEATAVWDTILDALSAPLPDDAGLADQRTSGQRRHDGLVDAGLRLLRSGDLPAAGGVPVTILIRTTENAAAGGPAGTVSGVATTSRGDLLSPRALARMSGDASIVPVVSDPGGAVLRLGREKRLATRAQRLALAARDGGCCFPGCDRPPSWSEVHHVTPWQDGGATDLDNLCMLCRHHHRNIEVSDWQLRMRDGVPEWTPPYWLDRQRRPRRNHAHHPPDIRFDSPSRRPAA